MRIDSVFAAKLKKAAGEGNVLFDEPMSRHTTFKIGGPADVFVSPRDEEGLIGVFGLCGQYGVPYTIIGNGSNLLVSDNGIDGVVISSANINSIAVEDNNIEAACGAMLSRVASAALKNSLSGLEFASGIPGTLGGAVYMNAGAYDGEIKDAVVSVRALCGGQVRQLNNEECGFSYRSSAFQNGLGVILSVKLSLTYGDGAEIAQRCRELNAKRREKQPLDMPSAGSVFKRPPGHFAGALIEQAGLKGFRIGGAQVSPKHAGFIVNAGGATARDVLDLVEYIKEKVKESSGVELHEEIKMVGRPMRI